MDSVNKSNSGKKLKDLASFFCIEIIKYLIALVPMKPVMNQAPNFFGSKLISICNIIVRFRQISALYILMKYGFFFMCLLIGRFTNQRIRLLAQELLQAIGTIPINSDVLLISAFFFLAIATTLFAFNWPKTFHKQLAKCVTIILVLNPDSGSKYIMDSIKYQIEKISSECLELSIAWQQSMERKYSFAKENDGIRKSLQKVYPRSNKTIYMELHIDRTKIAVYFIVFFIAFSIFIIVAIFLSVSSTTPSLQSMNRLQIFHFIEFVLHILYIGFLGLVPLAYFIICLSGALYQVDNFRNNLICLNNDLKIIPTDRIQLDAHIKSINDNLVKTFVNYRVFEICIKPFIKAGNTLVATCSILTATVASIMVFMNFVPSSPQFVVKVVIPSLFIFLFINFIAPCAAILFCKCELVLNRQVLSLLANLASFEAHSEKYRSETFFDPFTQSRTVFNPLIVNLWRRLATNMDILVNRFVIQVNGVAMCRYSFFIEVCFETNENNQISNYITIQSDTYTN